MQTLLNQLKQAQVRLYVRDDKLKAALEGAALSPELHAQISAHKVALQNLLADECDSYHTEWLMRLAGQPAAPLAFAQRRLWLAHQLLGDSRHYHIYVQDEWQGAVEDSLLRKALHLLLRRHQVLLSRYEDQHGEPVQLWHTDLQLPVHRYDWSAYPPEQLRQAMEWLTMHEAERPFNLAADFMFRLNLVELSGPRTLLCFTLHHIVADGWSVAILLGELRQLYRELAAGQRVTLTEHPLQYADFAQWQQQWLVSLTCERQLQFWLDQLQGMPATHQLPLDFPRPAQQTFQGYQFQQVVPGTLVEELKQICRQQQVTLFTLLHTAYMVLLARYSGQQDIVTGVPMSGRVRQEVEPLIGFFVNTVLLRLDLAAGQTFQQLLQQNKQVILAAHDAQQVPLDLLSEHLQLPRDPRQPALFQLAFQLLQASSVWGSDAAHHGQSAAIKACSVKVDLELHILQADNGLTCNWILNKSLFRTATIQRMAANFLVLLQSIVADLRQPPQAQRHWQRLALVSSAESQLPTAQWHQSVSRRPPLLVHRMFEARVAAQPTQTALVYQGQQFSYSDLNQQANQLAHLIKPQLTGNEPKVGIMLRRGPALVVAILAVLKAGAAYVPLDPDYPAERLQLMMTASDLCLLLIDEEPPLTIACKQHQLNLADPAIILQLSHCPTEQLPVVSEEPGERLLYVVFTSGSTGVPKGVLVQHASLLNYCQAEADYLAITPDSRFLHACSMSFDAGNGLLFSALLGGAALYLELPNFGLIQTLQNDSISHAVLPAAVLGALPQQALPALKVLAAGGEPLAPDTLQFWSQGRLLVNLYGPTETTVTAVCGAMTPTTPVNQLGRALPNVQTYVMDSDGQPVPSGVVGELYIGGAGVARGYLNQPGLTAARFVPDPAGNGRRLYRTGDLVRYQATGELLYLGRSDSQIKIRGLRVDLAEIEQVLSRHHAVRTAVVDYREIGAVHQLVGWVMLNSCEQPVHWQSLTADILQAAARQLPAFMLPQTLSQLSELPLSPNGKIDKQKLSLPAQMDVAPELPANDTESRMLACWQQLLGDREICVLQDFFAAGGHSLLALKLQTLLAAEFGQTLTLVELIKAGNIRGMAARMQQNQAATADQSTCVLFNSQAEPSLFLLLGLGLLPHRAHALAQAMPDTRLCVLQPPPGAAVQRLSMLSDWFAAEVQRWQPDGVVRILGHSIGGIWAFELAKHLERAGREVQLVLLECAFTELVKKDGRHPQFCGNDSQQNPELTAQLLQQAELVLNYQPFGFIRGSLSVVSAQDGLAGHPAMRDLHRLYQRLSAGPVYSHCLSGDHLSVLQAPCVQGLAALLYEIYQ